MRSVSGHVWMRATPTALVGTRRVDLIDPAMSPSATLDGS